MIVMVDDHTDAPQTDGRAVRRHGPTHGLRSTYITHACRCDACTQANREKQRYYTMLRAQRLIADPTLAPHGVVNTYDNWGCRCAACCQAKVPDNAAKSRERRARAANHVLALRQALADLIGTPNRHGTIYVTNPQVRLAIAAAVLDAGYMPPQPPSTRPGSPE